MLSNEIWKLNNWVILAEISDDGCLAVLPFQWGGIDIVTTPAPTTKPRTDPILTTAVSIVVLLTLSLSSFSEF